MHDFIRYAYRYRVRVGVTHRIEDLRVRNHRLRIGGEVVDVVEVVEVVVPSGVEVVDVVEVVVHGASSWQTLAFRSLGSTGVHGVGFGHRSSQTRTKEAGTTGR